MERAGWHKSRGEVRRFFAVTIVITWLLWFPAVLIRNFGFSLGLPYNLFITAGTFVPSLAGFVFTYLYGGNAEAYLLLKSLFDVRIPGKWYLFILFFLPGVAAVSCVLFAFAGNSLPQMQFAPIFIPVAFAYILIFMGPLGEELGWRGFALKRILQYLSPLKASLLVGAIWSTWHLPLFFINGTTQNILTGFGLLPALLGYYCYTIMFSILLTLLYIMSHGSLFAAILLHTMGNLSLGFIPLIFTKEGAIFLLSTFSITAAFIVYKYRNVLI